MGTQTHLIPTLNCALEPGSSPKSMDIAISSAGMRIVIGCGILCVGGSVLSPMTRFVIASLGPYRCTADCLLSILGIGDQPLAN